MLKNPWPAGAWGLRRAGGADGVLYGPLANARRAARLPKRLRVVRGPFAIYVSRVSKAGGVSWALTDLAPCVRVCSELVKCNSGQICELGKCVAIPCPVEGAPCGARTADEPCNECRGGTRHRRIFVKRLLRGPVRSV